MVKAGKVWIGVACILLIITFSLQWVEAGSCTGASCPVPNIPDLEPSYTTEWGLRVTVAGDYVRTCDGRNCMQYQIKTETSPPMDAEFIPELGIYASPDFKTFYRVSVDDGSGRGLGGEAVGTSHSKQPSTSTIKPTGTTETTVSPSSSAGEYTVQIDGKTFSIKGNQITYYKDGQKITKTLASQFVLKISTEEAADWEELATGFYYNKKTDMVYTSFVQLIPTDPQKIDEQVNPGGGTPEPGPTSTISASTTIGSSTTTTIKGEEKQKLTLKQVLQDASGRYAPMATSALWVLNLFAPDLSKNLKQAISDDLKLPPTAAKAFCASMGIGAPGVGSQSTMLGYETGKMPALQLQAIRSTPIAYPATNISKPGNETPSVSRNGTLYYTKITFRFEGVLDEGAGEGKFTLNLYGHSASKRFAIDLDPKTQATGLELNSWRFSMAGKDAIMRYWPVKLDRVCLEFKDPYGVLNPDFKRKLSNGQFCVPVVEVRDKWLVYQLPPSAGSNPAGNQQGDVLT